MNRLEWGKTTNCWIHRSITIKGIDKRYFAKVTQLIRKRPLQFIIINTSSFTVVIVSCRPITWVAVANDDRYGYYYALFTYFWTSKRMMAKKDPLRQTWPISQLTNIRYSTCGGGFISRYSSTRWRRRRAHHRPIYVHRTIASSGTSIAKNFINKITVFLPIEGRVECSRWASRWTPYYGYRVGYRIAL